MHTCKRCGAEKPAEQMLHRRGKPSKVCLECFGVSMRKGADCADQDAKPARGNGGRGRHAKKGNPL